MNIGAATAANWSALIFQFTEPMKNTFVVRYDDSALPGSDDFVWGKRETAGVAECSQAAFVGPRAKGLCCILDHGEPAVSGDVDNFFNPTSAATDMNWHHCFCFGSDRYFHRLHAQVESLSIDIGEHRSRAGHRNRIRRRNKSDVGNNYFVAMANAQSHERKINGRCSVRDANTEFGPGEFCDRLGELFGDIAVVDVVAAQDGQDPFAFFVTKFRLPPGDAAVHEYLDSS